MLNNLLFPLLLVLLSLCISPTNFSFHVSCHKVSYIVTIDCLFEIFLLGSSKAFLLPTPFWELQEYYTVLPFPFIFEQLSSFILSLFAETLIIPEPAVSFLNDFSDACWWYLSWLISSMELCSERRSDAISIANNLLDWLCDLASDLHRRCPCTFRRYHALTFFWEAKFSTSTLNPLDQEFCIR